VANSHNIKIVDIKVEVGAGQTKTIEIAKEQIVDYKIDKPNTLHGIFENGFSRTDQYIMCAVETEDNQFDFVRLYIWNRDTRTPD
jgi:hypothetical protein